MSVHTRAPLLTAATLFLTTAALAFEPPRERLAERIASADAVVLAIVSHIEYRMSRATADQPAIPHTFVTFVVDRVIRGQVDGGLLTLRFTGGLFTDGRFLDNPSASLFDVGERSILLVTRNGQLDAPLAGGRFGRLRIISGRVYDDFGKPLSIAGADRVRFGRTLQFTEVAEHTLGATGRSFNPRLRELPSAGPQDVAGPGDRPVPASPAVDNAVAVETLIAWIRALPPRASGAIVSSQDPNAAFSPLSRRPVRRAQ
jgi:hypothetical protein